MLQTVATVLLLGMMGAFAVCAVLLNEGNPARRRASRGSGEAAPPRHVLIPAEEAVEPSSRASDDRRLPAGDFLFGALFLRAPEPLAFAELADAAAGSGMDVAQVLAWVERAHAGGLVERVVHGESVAEAAVRLTEAGMDVARNNRRGGVRERTDADAADASRALHS